MTTDHDGACFIARHGVHESGQMPPCDGRLVKCHLIPRRILRSEVWSKRTTLQAIYESEGLFFPSSFESLVDHVGTWEWGCGGPMGNAGHHGMLDVGRTIRIPRSAIPKTTELLATALGVDWWLDREYGPKPAILPTTNASTSGCLPLDQDGQIPGQQRLRLVGGREDQ